MSLIKITTAVLAFQLCFSSADAQAIAATTSAGVPLATSVINGTNQVPEIETPATAQAVVELLSPGIFRFTLTIQNITNFTMAHIHAGNSETNGPVAVPLVPTSKDKSIVSGGLAMLSPPKSSGGKSLIFTSEFTAANLTGPLNGTSAEEFAMSIGQGDYYVNVHTMAEPAGLIRGQLVGVSPAPTPSPAPVPPSTATAAQVTISTLALVLTVVTLI